MRKPIYTQRIIENCSSKHGRDYSTSHGTCNENVQSGSVLRMIVKNKLSSKGNTRRINIRYISMFKYSNQQHVWEAAVTIAKRTRPSCNAKARLLFGSQLRRVGLSQSIQLKQCNLLTCNCVVKDGEKKTFSLGFVRKQGIPYFPLMIYQFHPM